MKFSLPLFAAALCTLPLAACAEKNTPAATASAAAPAHLAQAEPLIRKNLAERLPQLPKIEEVRAMPMPGLYEVRVGPSSIFYTDAQGNYLIQGAIMDTQSKKNLTEERMDKLTAIDFKALPTADAITFTYGNGSRKIAVFEDPNCGYCRRFEADLAKVKNVTVHVFLYPILGEDSLAKSQAIWCAKDRAKAWHDWMQRQVPPPAAQCDTSAIARNVELGRTYRINGTPAIVFANGKRIPGAADTATIEKLLAENK